jgi:hypothetical protein
LNSEKMRVAHGGRVLHRQRRGGPDKAGILPPPQSDLYFSFPYYYYDF